MIHPTVPMIKPPRKIAKKPKANGKTAFAKTHNAVIMPVGTIGHKPVKNMPMVKNQQISVPKRLLVNLLRGYGMFIPVTVQMAVNGIIKQCYVNATHKHKNTKMVNAP